MKKAFSVILSLFLVLTGLSVAAAEITLPIEQAELPNIVPAESMEDFVGAWELCGFSDIIATVLDKDNYAVAAMQTTLDITEQEAVMHVTTLGDAVLQCKFNAEDGTLLITSGEGDNGMVYYLYDNGMIAYTSNSMGRDMTLFFSRVEEPQE